jgi:FdhE protein
MEDQLKRLRRFGERTPQYREVLELAERMLGEKCRVKEQGPASSFTPDHLKAKIQMEEGFPYLRPSEVPLNAAQAGEYFACLLKGFAEVNPGKHESLKKALEEKDFDLEFFLRRLLDNRLSEPGLEEEFGPEGSLLFYFLVQTLKPVFEKMAEEWRTATKDVSWAQGFCPFCGGLPGMGEIRKEGKRILHCPLCGTDWEYPRIKCPYCPNEDHQQMTYFQVEGEPENRVDVCLACRNYVKTIDAREMEGALDIEVEDYLTLHLDHLAQEEGYSRPSKLFVEMK